MTEKILYTGGTFDLFHAGHVNFVGGLTKYDANNRLKISG
mgnify:CR=1 FL=1